MRITFDSNTWEKVVAPDEYPTDLKLPSFAKVHAAVRDGRLSGFICETFATLEAIRKGTRAAYLNKRAEDVAKVVWHESVFNEQTGTNRIRGTLEIGGGSAAHPGLHPIPEQRFKDAITLGFRLLPTARIGTARPPEIDDEAFRIPLTDEQRDDIWGFLDRIAEITQAIEDRGVGFSVIEAIAGRIQERERLPKVPWYEGLNKPIDAAEGREIDRAFAEWADGDTVALHIAYGLDAICTEDHGKSAGKSVFDTRNRAWLQQKYGVEFLDIETLALRLT